ncbi:MAG: hypothetical protein AAGA20_22765 [Planctomycetota bacterium]
MDPRREADDPIRALEARRSSLERLRALLEDAEEQFGTERRRLDELRTRVREHTREVVRLEGRTLKALLHTVLSSRKERLESARDGAERARERLDECRDRVAALESERDRLSAEIEALSDVDADLARAVSERQDALLRSDSVVAHRLREIVEEHDAALAEVQRLGSAIDAGRRAKRALKRALHKLERARSMGSWDLLGGGFFATAAKHSRLDEGRARVAMARAELRTFHEHLHDIDRIPEHGLEVAVTGADRVADYVLDNPIVDWMVQSKITGSVESVGGVTKRVIDALATLGEQRAALRIRLDELETQRVEVVRSASPPGA